MKRNFYDTIPTSVRIGCYTYAIVVMADVDQATDRIFGDMNHTLLRIRLCAGMPTAQLANTFMHEVMHAIHRFHNVEDKTSEEDTTLSTTNGLCAFWMDNPVAAAWWADAVQDRPLTANTELLK